ncbi:MAG: cyclic nucleotide-binding domain-containing protein [Dehalococcoidales bacterium]|nr:cyclic nucleotide-binding domain-containing protein [Dehalococcoidales bacterium]
MTSLEILKRVPFVRELDEGELIQLAKMAKEETFQVGQDLVRQGKPANKLYVIEEGLVGIYLELGPMSRRQIQSASNFEVIGWSSMLPPYRAADTARAIEETKVLVFDSKELIKMCDDNPVIGNKVHRGVASLIAVRLRNAFTQLMGVTAQE